MLCRLIAIKHALHRIRSGSAEPAIVVLAKLRPARIRGRSRGPRLLARAPQPEPTDAGALANRRAWRFDDGMSNLLSTLRALIVGAPKASIGQPLPIVGLPLGFGPPPLEVTRRKYARSPLKVRGGRARARTATRDARGRFTTNAFAKRECTAHEDPSSSCVQ